ncbi:MAG: FG-GAP repeat protein [Planctomycetota bacterium]
MSSHVLTSLRRAAFVAAVLGAAVFAAPAHAQFACEDASLTWSGIVSGDAAGYSVAIDGDRAIVGAPFTGDIVPGGGAAHVFERKTDGSWAHVAELIPSAIYPNGNFGRAVAIDGDVAVCGAALFGRVFVFERQANGTWLEAALVDAPALQTFATGLDVDGGRIAIGYGGNPTFLTSGGVDVYERAGGTWGLAQTVTAIDGYDPDFGRRVRIEGDRIVAGSPGDDRAAIDAGAAFVFERGGVVWSRTAVLTAPNAAEGDAMGSAVALFDDTVVAGASGRDTAAADGGSALVFDLDPVTGWSATAELTSSATVASDFFGSALDGDTDRVAVGASGFDGGASATGGAALFERDGSGAWHEVVLFVAEGAPSSAGIGAQNGDCIAVDGGRCLFGASGAAGSAFALDFASFYRGLSTVSLAAGGVQSMFLRGSADLGGDAFLVLGSLTGTSPGVPLAPGVELPLVVDAYTQLGLALNSPVAGAFGLLDAEGGWFAQIAVPPGTNPSFAGKTLHHAYLTIDLATFAVSASDAIALDLVL